MATNPQKKEIAGILIENGRLSFDDLYEPTASVKDGKLQYRACILIDPNTDVGKRNIKKIENAIRLAELEKFKRSPVEYKSDDRRCFFDGEECKSQKTGEVYSGYEGMKMLRALNQKRPAIVNRDAQTPIYAEDNVTYAGCYCNFFIRIYCVSGADKGGNGCYASLETVQFVKDGEPFGGAPVDPKSVFKNLEQSGDSAEEEDPLG